ncbi:MAG: FAD-dependent oxidoreductase [Desulfamplus sp.]|nr:FAD-dependent oxidoreductase [Desulfamplus sp.]
MTTFSHLFTPIQIGNMHVKNRLMMSAMSINFGVDENCHVTDQLTQYFVERAKGGVGMMLVGGGSVHPGGQELPDLPVMYEDSSIPTLQKMVQAVKAIDEPELDIDVSNINSDKSGSNIDRTSMNRVKFGVQLMHGGRQSYLPQKVAPSAIPAPAVVKGEVRALEVEEIKELVQCFGSASKRCKDAGFDFVEIHAAHGYLINQFMSENSNIRQDQYGGTFENRTRFLFEIIEDIREKAGKEFPVGIRMNGKDYIQNGWELEDAVRLAPMLEKAGVAYLHISGGVYGSTELTIPSMYSKHGCFVHLAEEVKKHVSIPVITVGRIKTPMLADEILKDGKADMVSMGRALLADPYLPLKAQQGRLSEIRPCIGCCLGCIHAVLAKEPGSCVVNPDVGREYKLKEEHRIENSFQEKIVKKISGEVSENMSDQRQKILVVGAGPSGMACARLFALRGHNVMIVEKKSVSGGLLLLAAKAPGRSELGDILDFFKKELERLNVKILYGKAVDEKILTSFAPDKVVVATGSMPDMPLIKGLFQSQMDVVTSVDILSADQRADSHYTDAKADKSTDNGFADNQKMVDRALGLRSDNSQYEEFDQDLSGKKIIVLGGGMTGLITADYIAAKSNEVYVLNRKKSFAEEMSANDRYYLRENLKKKGVTLYKNVAIDSFTSHGVKFHIKNGESCFIDGCDMVVISEKHISIRDIKKLESITQADFHFIGDAKSPRHLMYCISEAEEIARS